MKVISWNVNGINACYRKGLIEFMEEEDADVYCFQELKSSEETINPDFKELSGYHSYFNFADKKGYSGVAIYSKIKPNQVKRGFDDEGRVLILYFDEFALINAYFPNAGRGLKRLDYKLEFNQRFESLLKKVHKKVIIAGDLNVAHKPKDLANPASNKNNAGYTIEEREWFTQFLNKGFVDTFREFNEEGGNYTFWTYMHNAREKNIGWRLDYFVAQEELMKQVEKSEILNEVKGSDHCPIKLVIE